MRHPRANSPLPYMAWVAGLRADIEDVGGFGLHAEGDFHTLDGRLQLGGLTELFDLHLVQLAQQIELAALLREAQLRISERLNLLLGIRLGGGDEGALINRREERRAPTAGPAVSSGQGRKNDEAGQILVFRAEAVGDPRAHRRASDAAIAGVHHEDRRAVIGDIGDHRANLAEFVDDAAHLGEDLAHFVAVLPVLGPGEGRLHQIAGGELGARRLIGERLAVPLVELGLVIERIDGGQAAGEEHEDDVLGLGGEVRRLDGPGIGFDCGALGGITEQGGQGGHAESGSEGLQSFPARPGNDLIVHHNPLNIIAACAVRPAPLTLGGTSFSLFV